MRVILVGRTGLDDILREDASLELVRVRAPADAIGELATPVDDESPGEAVVVVSGEAQRDLLARSARVEHGAILGRARIVEFIRGLRMVDPAVRILGVAGEGAGDLFDATLPTSDDPDVLASAIRRPVAPRDVDRAEAEPSGVHQDPGARLGTRAEPDARFARDDATDPTPAPPPTTPPAAPGSFEFASPATREGSALGDLAPMPGAPDELEVVEQLLKGQDVIAPALEVLRARTGDPALAFTPGVQGEGPELRGTPVSWSGSRHGTLVASIPGLDLTRHARWLAGWIRLRDQQAQLREAAFTDPLTGAWNRRYFDRFLSFALEHARQQRWSVTILLFDIDDFKRYNDEYGHEAGDEILVECVRLMRSVTRPDDRICRIGGDEFAVAFHDPSGPRSPDSKHPASVSDIAHRFQKEILGHRFPKLLDCAPGTLTISGGLATFPWDGATPRELLAIADERAMESKREGKNAITIGPGARLGA